MYLVGLDIDSRAYFTAAYGISSLMTLGLTTPLLLNNNKITRLSCKDLKSYSLTSTTSKSLIPYTGYSRGFGFGKALSKLQRDSIYLTPRLKSILIGIVISDGWMAFQLDKRWNPRIGFKQSTIHFAYLWFVFNEIMSLTPRYPLLTKATRRGITHYQVQLETRQLKCLIEIKNIFFVSGSKRKTKTIELFDYIDYLALAHWIMGDGSKNGSGLYLKTNSLNKYEQVIQINILIIKFRIDPRQHTKGGKRSNEYRIYINAKDMKYRIKPFVKVHFIKEKQYKIE